MRRTIAKIPVPGIRTFQSTPAGMIRAAVNEADWRQFEKGEGGALVVYPPRMGGELAGMVAVTITELRPIAVDTATPPKRLIQKERVS